MKKKLIIFFLLLTLIMSQFLYAQEVIFQKIAGKVTDQNTKIGIVSVHVTIKNENLDLTVITGDAGDFYFQEIPVGRYNIYLSHLNYEPKILRDVLVESGKEKVINIELNLAVKQLPELTITDDQHFPDDIEKISFYSFSQEQSQRFAATFNDPARMALTYPGITSANDQGNNISVRGNTPFSNSWRLEGAEIVNPNHLMNAGTLTDRPSVVGGGVSIISAQLMDQTKLYTGAIPSNFGNSTGGIMDIKLRNGNVGKPEYTVQAGILGLDLAAEGPFKKNSDNSFLINYRYSTIGLLQSMGVEVSPENISFQDLSFNLSFKSPTDNEWKIFGIFGLSNENFDAERDSTQWEILEDRIYTKFTSNMGATGLSNKVRVGERSTIGSTIALSKLEAERTGNYLDDNYLPQLIEKDIYDQGILTISSTFNNRTKKNHHLSAGIKFNSIFFDLLSQSKDSVNGSLNTHVFNKGNYQVLKFFGEWIPVISGKTTAQIGFHSQYFNFNDELTFEPRIEVNHFFSGHSSVSAYYGLISQSHFPQAYFVTKEINGEFIQVNQDLRLSKSHYLNLGYTHRLSPHATIKFEAYWQKHFDVPVSADSSGTYSILNAVDVFIDEELVNQGTGKNLGLEFLLNRAFKNGFYFTISSALFNSKYKALDGMERDTRYNGKYVSSLTVGKEMQSLKKGKNRIFGLNLRFIWQGGYRHTPIDVDASKNANQAVYIESEAFTEKYKDLIRTDIRIYFKKYKANYTRTLSIDIQNLTGQQNIAYEYFDPFTNQVETKYQLGLLPFISYKVEF